MKQAKRKDVTLQGYTGSVGLYELRPPMKDAEMGEVDHVIVSAVNVPFSGIETFIFPANEKGEQLSWTEMDGSIRGSFSHREALKEAGYTIVHEFSERRKWLMRVAEALGCVRESYTFSVRLFSNSPGENIVHKHLCKRCLAARCAVMAIGLAALVNAALSVGF